MEKINFHKQRNFSEKLNVTFEFIRQNFTPLGKSILYLVGPFSLIIGIFLVSYQKFMVTLSSNQENYESLSFKVISNMGTIWLLSMFALLMLISVVYDYFILYQQKPVAQIEVGDVLNMVKKDILKVFLAGIVTFLVVIVGFVFLVIPGIYLSVAVSLTFIIVIYEKKNPLEAVKRSIKLTSGKWWSTFGLILITSLIQGLVGFIFALPMQIMNFINLFHSLDEGSGNPVDMYADPGLINYLFSAIAMFAGLFLYAIVLIALGFQYFNLVERKEAVGLMQNIDQLGQESKTHEAN
ncbi:MAG: hypothetical protein ACNS62_14635 [Candidatus Cyclobacteriaceae bacterium M3_2C_046]